jgi:hypothetical protein
VLVYCKHTANQDGRGSKYGVAATYWKKLGFAGDSQFGEFMRIAMHACTQAFEHLFLALYIKSLLLDSLQQYSLLNEK